MEIIKAIQQETELHGVSAFADCVGVEKQTVYNWLNGSLPSGNNLKKLGAYFGGEIRIEIDKSRHSG